MGWMTDPSKSRSQFDFVSMIMNWHVLGKCVIMMIMCFILCDHWCMELHGTTQKTWKKQEAHRLMGTRKLYEIMVWSIARRRESRACACARAVARVFKAVTRGGPAAANRRHAVGSLVITDINRYHSHHLFVHFLPANGKSSSWEHAAACRFFALCVADMIREDSTLSQKLCVCVCVPWVLLHHVIDSHCTSLTHIFLKHPETTCVGGGWSGTSAEYQGFRLCITDQQT